MASQSKNEQVLTKAYVIKRNGQRQKILFDKISSRIQKLCYGLDLTYVNPTDITIKTCAGVHDGVHTHELDELAAETAAMKISEHPDYGILAARITMSNLHKSTHKSFSQVVNQLHSAFDSKTQKHVPLISDQVHAFVNKNAEALDAMIVHDRDFTYDYFGVQTLLRSYLLKIDGKAVERPQHMLMRVLVELYCDGDISEIEESYTCLSLKKYTHASPTLFNAATKYPQLASCFLLTMQDDSIEGIYETLKQCAKINKHAGGCGLAIQNIRASGTYIAGTNGTSNGIKPMLRVYNNTALYVDQGGGKRKGGIAIYLEPWHADIMAFLDMKRQDGTEENRARDLFYALWIPDLFMERVQKNEMWTLMSPDACPKLLNAYGVEFNKIYEEYEEQQRNNNTIVQVKARDVWKKMLACQRETGTPYMLYKDPCNEFSNQQNLGVIRCSNLCAEIIQYSSPEEIAVCNLSSIAVNEFVLPDKTYDFDGLLQVAKLACKNLNRVIDRTFYPVEQAKVSNLKHRPIGIGIQGLADAFCLMRYPFESKEAAQLNVDIIETIYYGALVQSMELAKKDGPYESYAGSPMSKGLFQFDLWKVKPSSRYPFDELRKDIEKYGIRNSQLLALMPTASTSNILGNNECFEPFTSNIYVRRTNAGEYTMVNKHLVRDLIELNMWNDDVQQNIIIHDGSVQHIPNLPQEIKELYKTVWEISPKVLIDYAAARQPFICNSQSLNIFMNDPTENQITSMHMYGFKKRLKTGMYYLRTQRTAVASQFSIDRSKKDEISMSKKRSAFDDKINSKSKVQKIQENSQAFILDPGYKEEIFKASEETETKKRKNGTIDISKEELVQQKLKQLCSRDNREDCQSCGA